jgi:hypothetical protein
VELAFRAETEVAKVYPLFPPSEIPNGAMMPVVSKDRHSSLAGVSLRTKIKVIINLTFGKII